jgi:two-component system response regulator FixJ
MAEGDALTVFIVDDDEAVRDSLHMLLDSIGIANRPYVSGEEFLAEIGPKHRGCILLDVRMPGINGLEVQQRLLARREQLPVIVITGHGDVPMAIAAMKAGAFEFIEKPFKNEILVEAIGRALEQVRRVHEKSAIVDAQSERLAQLTPRERQVLENLVVGRPNKVIAYELGISPRTVEIHRARVMEKMEARSLSELVRIALALGLDAPPS